MFYDNYLHLCNKKGVAPTTAALEMGFKRSSVTKWKNGGKCTDATAQRIAEYFGITKDELMAEKSPTPKEGAGDEFSNISIEDMEYIKKYLSLGVRGKYKVQGMLDLLVAENDGVHKSLAADLMATAKEKSEAASNMQHSDFTKR